MIHQLLCVAFAEKLAPERSNPNLEVIGDWGNIPRPRRKHSRVIVFNPDKELPEIVWVRQLQDQWIESLLGPGCRDPYDNDARHEPGPVTRLVLPLVLNDPVPYCIQILYRANFDRDGSLPNRSISTAVTAASGDEPPFCWRGPVVVLAGT